MQMHNEIVVILLPQSTAQNMLLSCTFAYRPHCIRHHAAPTQQGSTHRRKLSPATAHRPLILRACASVLTHMYSAHQHTHAPPRHSTPHVRHAQAHHAHAHRFTHRRTRITHSIQLRTLQVASFHVTASLPAHHSLHVSLSPTSTASGRSMRSPASHHISHYNLINFPGLFRTKNKYFLSSRFV